MAKNSSRLLASTLVILLLSFAAASSRAADLMEGLAAYQNGNFDLALAEFEPLARGGDFNAQYHLGELYLQGDGVEQDLREAFDWFFKAAEQGHVQAQANVGSLLSLGLGVSRDMPTAYYWWILSAVWTTGPLQSGAMGALGEVAPQLTDEERRNLAQQARAGWRGLP